MPLVLLCGGEVVKRVFERQPGFVLFDPLRVKQQLKQVELVLAHKETREWGPEFEDGLHFTAVLRLQYQCELPVLIVEPDPVLQPVRPGMRLVYDDPLVRRLFFSEMHLHQTPRQLLGLFDLSLPAEDRKLLFQDLRQTLYREEGYLDELRHRAMRVLSHMNGWENAAARQKLLGYLQQAHDMARYWLPSLGPDFSPEALMERAGQPGDSAAFTPLLQEWFDGLCATVRPVAAHKEQEQQVDACLLYISDSEESRKALEARFASAYTYYHIHCIGLDTLDSAMERLKAGQGSIIAVASDFRFRDAEGRVALRNGYHIICRLKEAFPDCLYLFLTNFPLAAYEGLPLPEKVKIFNKSHVLSPHSRAFAYLAREILYHRENTLSHRDAWPEALNGKDDEAWRVWYGRFVDSVDYEAAENELSDKARMAIRTLLEKRPFSIPPTGTQFSKLAKKYDRLSPNADLEEKIMAGLHDKLLARRIYLGLFQIDLLHEFPEFSKLLTGYLSPMEQGKQAMALAFCVLFPHKAENLGVYLVKTLSNHFTNLRLSLKVDYRIKSTLRDRHITKAEYQWLVQARRHFQEKHLKLW